MSLMSCEETIQKETQRKGVNSVEFDGDLRRKGPNRTEAIENLESHDCCRVWDLCEKTNRDAIGNDRGKINDDWTEEMEYI